MFFVTLLVSFILITHFCYLWNIF